MSAIDDFSFTFKERKSGLVSIFWYDRPVYEIKGKKAVKFLQDIQNAHDERSKQLLKAKLTGNFKRGNEKNRK